MANYDPKRNRPAAVVTDDDVAPIDAILGAVDAAPVEHEIVESAVPEIESESESPEPTVDLRVSPDPESEIIAEPIHTEAPRLAGSPIEVVPGPDRTTQRIAIVAGVAAATTALIVLWRRRQR